MTSERCGVRRQGAPWMCAGPAASTHLQKSPKVTQGNRTHQETHRVVIRSRRHALKGRARRPLDGLDGRVTRVLAILKRIAWLLRTSEYGLLLKSGIDIVGWMCWLEGHGAGQRSNDATTSTGRKVGGRVGGRERRAPMGESTSALGKDQEYEFQSSALRRIIIDTLRRSGRDILRRGPVVQGVVWMGEKATRCVTEVLNNMGCREAAEADESDFQAAKGKPLHFPLPRTPVVRRLK